MVTDFSFVVLTFNQEEYIIETLESIKSQILNYGNDLSFQIIISDDSSNDNTVKNSLKWLDYNANLFKDIKILDSKKNKGIVDNFLKGINELNGKYFKVLAGDDIFGLNNIFCALKLLDYYDIVQFTSYEFVNEKVLLNKHVNSLYFIIDTSYKNIKNKLLLGSYIFHSSTIYKKELITDNVKNFMKKFVMCEDHTLFYSIFNENKNLKFYLDKTPIVLYRDSPSSIGRTKILSEPKLKLIEDNIKLYKYFFRICYNPFKIFYYKNILLGLKYQMSKNVMYGAIYNLCKIINLYGHYIKFKFKIEKHKNREKFLEIYNSLNEHLNENNQYLQRIKDLAKSFISQNL